MSSHSSNFEACLPSKIIVQLAGSFFSNVLSHSLSISVAMASLDHPDLHSMLDVQIRRNQRTNAHLERLETLPSDDVELRRGSLEG